MSESNFISHLLELRTRLIRTTLVLLVAFGVAMIWSQDLYDLLAKPLIATLPLGSKLISTEIGAPFFVPMKAALMAAFLVTLPHSLYQIWAFIAPGLYHHEKKLVVPLIISSTLLFALGMAFAYFLMFPTFFKFMVAVTPASVAWTADISKYFDFVLGMFVAFGVAFEVPVVVVVLVKMGFVSVTQLSAARAYVVVGAFAVAAVVTPPDVVSQLMLAIPLWLLYEAGILVSRIWVNRSQLPVPLA